MFNHLRSFFIYTYNICFSAVWIYGGIVCFLKAAVLWNQAL